jgi:hypothetical protein
LNSTARADSEERKQNRIVRLKPSNILYKFHIALYCQSYLKGTERLVNEIENVKKALKTPPLQGIVASLEGMKIRSDREVLHLTAFPKLLILGERSRFTT